MTSALVSRLMLMAAFAAAPARAQDYEDPSGRPIIAVADFRLTAADGERSWLQGGLGKARFGNDGQDALKLRARAVEGSLVLHPTLGFSVDGTAVLVAQQGQQHAVDLSEVIVSWRRDPHGSFRLSARAGLFWPPVSLEHSGPEWAVTETITASAINSWIGEEVKVGGIEATGAARIAGRRVSLTAAIFGFNDTAGTLLAFRGWALHDQKATAFGLQPLPTLDPFMAAGVQAARTRPVIELDDRPGWYAKLSVSPLPGFDLQLLHYDNRGDPEAVTDSLQWGWRTTFTNLGVRWHPAPGWTLSGQAMSGCTKMGFPENGKIWVDTDYRAAFLLATRAIGSGSVSGRIEAFGTRGRGGVIRSDDREDGWAATLAGRWRVNDHVSLLAEALRIESRRPGRLRDGLDPKQDQTVLQLALRVRS